MFTKNISVKANKSDITHTFTGTVAVEILVTVQGKKFNEMKDIVYFRILDQIDQLSVFDNLGGIR